MAQVIENRAIVRLTALSDLTDGPGAHWRAARVQVTWSHDVEGFPNLLAAHLPREFEALVPLALADDFSPGAQLRATACLAGPGTIRIEEIAQVGSDESPSEGPAEDPRS